MFFVNDPGPWQSFILRGDNVGRPINEVTQKYLHEQLQFDNFMSMQQQLQTQQFQNKGPLLENTPPTPPEDTITIEILVESPGETYTFTVAANSSDTGIIIDYGDGNKSGRESIFPNTIFSNMYENAGTYTLELTFTNPENVTRITSNQND